MYPDEKLDEEAKRLFQHLETVKGGACSEWTLEACRLIAPTTLEINELKKEKNAIILAHSYVDPEIVYGVSDLKGDSYALSLDARNTNADIIIFAGVVFMAETAKILSPEAQVLVPDHESGCSLADSLTGEELVVLKKKYPDAAVVCYINCTADVKAECDVCVTSSNVHHIIESLPEKKILFVPDKLMGKNIQIEMDKRGVDKEIITSDGTCIVHDVFDTSFIDAARKKHPEIKVVAHPECTPEVANAADYVGSTGGMMDYVKNSGFKSFMMLTECGLVNRLESEAPDKEFIGSCKFCPYMKKNNLYNILQLLKDGPSKNQIIEVNEEIRIKAKASIDKMFSMCN
ncbi:MAG: quinolinate synthase [Planctomycetota bacterium]|nr:MAG: quinolinate synthase [Planctomycetota bacterium]